ncbi:hypothetical protein [Microcoleus sp. POL10_C6]|uniref:hypothetical protein n=1 Tax=Microcoleus sp. POL10_C6 TaxID=2818852 RepID=UPI002FCFC6F5
MNKEEKVRVKCFIAQFEGVEGHAVYLAIERMGEVELTVISIHSTAIKAWSVVVGARRILESSSYSYQHSNELILKTFLTALLADSSSYPVQDPEEIEIDSPRKWKIFSTKSKHPHFPKGVFVIGTSPTEILMLEDQPKKLILSNTYMMCAYIADFMNQHHLDSLLMADINRLIREAQRAFSSTKHHIVCSFTPAELLKWAYK